MSSIPTSNSSTVLSPAAQDRRQRICCSHACRRENRPDTFQAHAGAELQDYIDAAQVEDVSDLYEEFGLTEAFPQDLLDRLTVDGAIYSVPANIHRANVVWENPGVLEEAGLDPEAEYASIDDWIEAMEGEAWRGQTPLSVATDVDVR